MPRILSRTTLSSSSSHSRRRSYGSKNFPQPWQLGSEPNSAHIQQEKQDSIETRVCNRRLFHNQYSNDSMSKFWYNKTSSSVSSSASRTPPDECIAIEEDDWGQYVDVTVDQAATRSNGSMKPVPESQWNLFTW
jgi:predicted DNA-binding transcriptional regulator AlpA